MSSKKSHSISVFLNNQYPAIDHGEGIYLYDTDGNRYIDASSGPITCSLGHGVTEIAEAMKKKMILPVSKLPWLRQTRVTHLGEEDGT